MSRYVNRFSGPQSGMSLVIVMMLLLVMTILGIGVLRGVLMEERMSANMYDRSLAFQQAESALREGEARVRAVVQGGGGMGYVVGIKCGLDPNHTDGTIDPNNCRAPVDAYSGTGGLGTCASGTDPKQACWFTAADNLGSANNSAGAPQYFIQFMGLRDSATDLGLDSSANASQYGGSGGVVREAFYRVFARSHDPNGSNRAVVVLQGNVVVR